MSYKNKYLLILLIINFFVIQNQAEDFNWYNNLDETDYCLFASFTATFGALIYHCVSYNKTNKLVDKCKNYNQLVIIIDEFELQANKTLKFALANCLFCIIIASLKHRKQILNKISSVTN